MINREENFTIRVYGFSYANNIDHIFGIFIDIGFVVVDADIFMIQSFREARDLDGIFKILLREFDGGQVLPIDVKEGEAERLFDQVRDDTVKIDL